MHSPDAVEAYELVKYISNELDTPESRVRPCTARFFENEDIYDDINRLPCSSEVLKPYCIGQQFCLWYKTRQKNSSAGFIMVPKTLLFDKSLKQGQDKLVYVVLLNFANKDTNECWPSHKMLADLAGYSISTVKRSLENLEEKGYVGIENRKDGLKNQSNLYTCKKTYKPVSNPGLRKLENKVEEALEECY